MPPCTSKALAAGASAQKLATTATSPMIFSCEARGRQPIRMEHARATGRTCQSLGDAARTLWNLAPPPEGWQPAAQIEELGYGAIWIGGSPSLTEVRPFLDSTSTVTVVSGIVNVWRHEPAE